jgi:hypothetical protein
MIEHADQLVLEYLSRANDAAHRSLGARERIDFMARLRQRIEEERAAAGGATEPAQVRKVLPVGAGLLGGWLLRAVGARTVRVTRGRARGR